MRPLFLISALLALCALPSAALRAGGDPLVAVVLEVAADRGEKTASPASLSSAPMAPPPSDVSCAKAPAFAENNPYIESMASGARAYFVRRESGADWPRLEAGKVRDFFGMFGTASDRDVRGTAARMEALLWLFANPASPLRHDPEVLRRFLRRAHAYADAIETSASAALLRPGQVLLDDFAIAPVSCSLREFAALYPGLLLPEQRRVWDRAMRIAADEMMKKAAGFDGRYANIDLALSFELLNFGLHLRDESLLAKSRALFSAQEANILPDGGLHYIWSQNESPGYHDVVAQFIARTHEITGDETALAMLRRLEWYGPVGVGRRGEYWTAPSWKHTWNGGEFSTGGEAVVAATRNPFVRGMLVPPVPASSPRGWERHRHGIAWWRPDIPARELPDNYTILDRNIGGPRAWYGPFNYAATLRDIPPKEPGHATLMGAQLTAPDFGRGVLLMGVAPRVYLGGDRAQPRSFAWLTSGLRSDLAMGRSWAGFAGDYQLHVFGSSTKGRLVPWLGRQAWIGLPDRIVGVLDITPESAATPAAELEGLVRLGTGGTVYAPRQNLREIAPGRYRFGDLRIVVHASTYGQAVIETTPFRLPAAPFADLVLRDPGPVAAPRRFVVEIAPDAAPAALAVRAASSEAGLEGLRVELPGKIFTLWHNTGSEASVSIPGANEPLPAGKVRVLIRSEDTTDSAPAWPSFSAMAEAKRS